MVAEFRPNHFQSSKPNQKSCMDSLYSVSAIFANIFADLHHLGFRHNLTKRLMTSSIYLWVNIQIENLDKMKRSLGLKLIWVTYLIDIFCNPLILLAHDFPANHPYCIDVVFDVVWRYTSCQLMMAAKSSHNNIVTASRQCWQAACIVHRYWNNTETMSIINTRVIILFYVIDPTLKQCCLTTSTTIMDTTQWVSKETIQ